MLGFDGRAARYTWSAVLVVILLCLVYLLRTTIFVFIVSLLLAYLLYPLVNLLDRLLPTRTRTAALALAYILFIGLLVFAGTQIGTRVVEQANALSKQLPELLSKWQSPGGTPLANFRAQVIEKIQEQLRTGAGEILSALPQAGMKFLTLASDLVYVVVIPILAFFFLKDAHEMSAHLVDLVEAGPRRELLEDLMGDVHLLLAHYMRALVVLSVVTFAAYGIAFGIMGIPYTILLAVMAAVLEFIPMIGPLSAAVVVTIVAAMSGHGVIPVLIFMGVYRVFQDYVLSPHIMGAGVEMPPLAVLFGVFAGAEIAGIAGAFLSVPILALLRIMYRRFRKARVASKLAAPVVET